MQSSPKDNNFMLKPSQTEVTINFTRLFDYQDIETTFKALVVLDNDIDWHILDILEAKCEHMIVVDGGANKIYNSKFKDSKKLRCIIGDLDGIKPQVKQYYHQKGFDLIHDPDQNTTDFEKTLNFCHKEKYDEIVVLNFYPGRIDHVLSGISATQRQLGKNPQKHIILIGMNSLMLYLHPKIDYKIDVKTQMIEQKACGLITFGKVDQLETQGFKWNLGEKEYFKSIQWGKFLSTSNEFQKEFVKISSSHQLFLVASLKNRIKNLSSL